MKLSQVIELLPALNALSGIKLPAATAYKVSKATNLVKTIVNNFEVQKIEAARRYGTETPDSNPGNPGGTRFSFTEEATAGFRTELEALLSVDEDLVLPKIMIHELNNISIEPSVLMALEGTVLFEVEHQTV